MRHLLTLEQYINEARRMNGTVDEYFPDWFQKMLKKQSIGIDTSKISKQDFVEVDIRDARRKPYNDHFLLFWYSNENGRGRSNEWDKRPFHAVSLGTKVFAADRDHFWDFKPDLYGSWSTKKLQDQLKQSGGHVIGIPNFKEKAEQVDSGILVVAAMNVPISSWNTGNTGHGWNVYEDENAIFIQSRFHVFMSKDPETKNWIEDYEQMIAYNYTNKGYAKINTFTGINKINNVFYGTDEMKKAALEYKERGARDNSYSLYSIKMAGLDRNDPNIVGKPY